MVLRQIDGCSEVGRKAITHCWSSDVSGDGFSTDRSISEHGPRRFVESWTIIVGRSVPGRRKVGICNGRVDSINRMKKLPRGTEGENDLS